MRVAFIAPLAFTTLSGGYAYDRRIIAGLVERLTGVRHRHAFAH